MTAIIFLGAAIAASIVGSVIIAIRNRPRTGMYQSIDDFTDHLRALAPETDDEGH